MLLTRLVPPRPRPFSCAPARASLAAAALATVTLVACEGSPAGPGPQEPEPSPGPPPGQWEIVAPVPVGAWSSALLPTGKVLLFQGGEQMYIWDPETRQFGAQFSSNTNLFCAGLTFLADGRLLAVGGHAGQDDEEHFLGLRSAEVFDPWQERWTQLPDMAGGERWYPTAVTLPDGRVLVASGTHAGVRNEAIELFDPLSQEWQVVAQQQLPLYPWAAVLPDGGLIFYGPQAPTAYFDWTSGTFSEAGRMSRSRNGGAGVLLNAGTAELLALGGGDPTTGATEIFDASAGAWRPLPAMARARHHPDVVLLPDGTALVIGGHSGAREGAREGEGEGAEDDVLMVEVLDADRTGWSEAAPANYGHGYHSTALLLPDGSVMAAGPERQLEVNLPWYFFAGERPDIASAPAQAGYGEVFAVTTTDAAGVVRVVLIRVSSATHSLNTDQRYLTLELQQVSERELSLQAPASPSLAPPGYYLLFVVTDGNVPSKGRFLLIR